MRGSGGEANELINFVRGADIHRENVDNTSDPRTSLLGDTFHSELIFVGAPRAGFSSDAANFGKSESFYRFEKNYGTFAATHKLRRAQIYVCLLYTSPSPRDRQKSRMPSSA